MGELQARNVAERYKFYTALTKLAGRRQFILDYTSILDKKTLERNPLCEDKTLYLVYTGSWAERGDVDCWIHMLFEKAERAVHKIANVKVTLESWGMRYDKPMLYKYLLYTVDFEGGMGLPDSSFDVSIQIIPGFQLVEAYTGYDRITSEYALAEAFVDTDIERKTAFMEELVRISNIRLPDMWQYLREMTPDLSKLVCPADGNALLQKFMERIMWLVNAAKTDTRVRWPYFWSAQKREWCY